jgi:hypothetical protein
MSNNWHRSHLHVPYEGIGFAEPPPMRHLICRNARSIRQNPKSIFYIFPSEFLIKINGFFVAGSVYFA